MRCSRCKKEGLTKEDFYPRSERAGLRSECKQCTKEIKDLNRKKHRERFTNWKRQDRFIMGSY